MKEKVSVIRSLRSALGMSQEAFARAIGKSYASVRMYEDGRKVPPAVMAKMFGLANKAGLKELLPEIEHWAADLYDHPIEAKQFEDLAIESGESPAERKRLHEMLDYVLDGAPVHTAQALRETVRTYFRAIKLWGDPFADTSHDDFVESDGEGAS
jgi:transcriptional regulator with XRE-family HTH domain